LIAAGPWTVEQQRRAAAARAVEEVTDGMVVGLGTGSTASLAIEALGARVTAGLRITGIPTSERSAALATQLRIPLTDFAAHRHLDLTIDGADEVEPRSLSLIKGRGGALLREKIVAAASARMIVVVDESKLVPHLGAGGTLPVEIVAFGWQTVLERIARHGLAPTLRSADAEPFVTDGGNYIADCAIEVLSDPAMLDAQLAGIVGVVETGLFLGLASAVIVGRSTGVEVLET
jgi:ribose 5-phosphate isomerase A